MQILKPICQSHKIFIKKSISKLLKYWNKIFEKEVYIKQYLIDGVQLWRPVIAKLNALVERI